MNEEKKPSVTFALPKLISDEELRAKYQTPNAFDKRVVHEVVKAVYIATKENGVTN